MRKHIQGLNEFDDFSDLDSLLGGFEELGITSVYGWAFQWDSTTEVPLVEIVISSSAKEALDIYFKHGWFSEDVSYMLESNKQIKTISDVFDNLVKQKVIFNSKIVYDLRLKPDLSIKTAYIREKRDNPFVITETLNTYFSNAEEVYRKTFMNRGSAGYAGGPLINI